MIQIHWLKMKEKYPKISLNMAHGLSCLKETAVTKSLKLKHI